MSVYQYKIVSVYVTSQPVYSVFAMLREHFPGDIAVYISHSNSFCARYLPLPLSHFSFSFLLCAFLYLASIQSHSRSDVRGHFYVRFNQNTDSKKKNTQRWMFV